GPICNDLREDGALLAASFDYQHSYPHSWRSKAKVIYRCTPQWFVAMDRPLGVQHPKTRAEMRWENEGGAALAPPPPSAVPLPTPSAQGGTEGSTSSLSRSDGEGDRSAQPIGGGATLRQLAMQAIAETRFVPEKGRNRIGSMVEGRPDWVLSRQRAWGVPIAVFVERKTGRLLIDPEVNQRIVAAIKAEGVDAWDEERAQEYLGDAYNAADYERVTDILDVWFDSGCTHVFTLESGHWPEQRWPADLYLEGSDQHRGWFQSSLLQSCGTRGRAPYDQVLTHGFTMDSKGMKMSKSLGNTISPLDLMRDYGADILRLWALSVDFTEDHRIGKEILAGVGDQYRKLRNTFRYLLGALDGFSDDERIAVADMPELERYMLALTAELDARLRKAVNDYDFNDYVRALSDFCNEDLSAFFFDIRKDSLYCDSPNDPKRRAYRTVLDILFHALVRWAAPVMVFTAEEVWGTRYPDGTSVHLTEWPLIDSQWREDAALEAKWAELRQLRETVTEAIEPLRRDKVIGSSLEAVVTVPSDADPALLAELFIVSSVRQGNELSVAKTDHHKCGRCWRLLPEVKADGDLCARCEGVVNG
ncbi:MAG TPA: class I tRNA ligase family protein, partial [Sphingomicrobium sp.]|nr:class I tRNA ligase family protein [Sphingomicrobium sp.]